MTGLDRGGVISIRLSTYPFALFPLLPEGCDSKGEPGRKGVSIRNGEGYINKGISFIDAKALCKNVEIHRGLQSKFCMGTKQV